jgi:hypothetical protein
MLPCGTVDTRFSKIIYDQSTGNMYVKVSFQKFRADLLIISVTSRGSERDEIRDKFQWSDTLYIAFELAKRPKDDRNWRLHSDTDSNLLQSIVEKFRTRSFSVSANNLMIRLS